MAVELQCRTFEPTDLEFIMELCAAEGYESYSSDPEKTRTVLTAPGVSTVVAELGDERVGFCCVQSDGEIQAHLSLVVVVAEQRGRGVGWELVRTAFAAAGGTRLDLVSTEGSDAFYQSFPHQRHSGFRLYPDRY